ncbi:WSC domain-containing protein [Sodiomyces alkalinus F11]|uniref:WSC domain-containing protein n=1 Tax=Sodiomyces alkalinus (strain CBS 110278 / VKM F-3762 / F11) TaxID=1314773 RepID=A0A3N2PRC1_SODAK|nr:WSC domain-containing protein [Sodiomyces alkalinus F11]ROT36896.1 WSC domain-containing protein [Sodiomyces alkalinus F11]
MTNEVCAEFCADNGFSYAGTEWFHECYCGNSLAPGGILANEADCNTPCAGDSAQPCGGGNRLTLYFNEGVTGPGVNPGVDGWESMGCYTEGTTGRTLTHGVGSIPGAEMTVAKCVAACETADFILAGVEYGGECYCGNSIQNGGAPSENGCNMLCNGNSTEYCGGPGHLNIYNFENSYEPPSATATGAPSAPVSAPASASVSASSVPSSVVPGAPTEVDPEHPETIGSYNWYGCQTEGTGTRALSAKTFADDDMTLAACEAFCDGYTFFGTEYGRECYCGNQFNTGSQPAPESDCNMPCGGSPLEFCGAGNRLSVYALEGAAPQPSDSPIPSPSALPSESDVSATTTGPAVPAPTDYPSGWEEHGCWVDAVAGRILAHQGPDDQTLTLGKCAHYCYDLGYRLAGAQYHHQCFCGNEIINGGVEANSESECNTPCAGNSAQMCGGPARMLIISDGPPDAFAPPEAQKSGFNGDWTYQGCVQGIVDGGARTFFWQNFMPGVMTANTCLDRCAEYGYMAAGLEYGQECYCGDPANIDVMGAAFRPESECNVLCAGNQSSICGGGSRMSTYFWTGDPLYSWDFPQDRTEAGEYELLIGGVVIPLITMESITGKVSFLEKWGTGPINSTGAYELDLSLVPDFDRAWREMHVRTDLFCAAGVTLPDKAGRQLTVGGWSGESTYGVRLYWPDGSAGVNGTNDWEENVNVLSLQDGRWYPTAMIMANGSIFVIGGEEGSNGAPVPTIELLPSTGTAPLYMDWLERTDPNNLYPFCAVLPSEDIFVAYWNEARILDKTTFETRTELPNIPGAVNNPMGGRTYPLEGTGVLLPQHAPYDEPLGILICGGSTEGASTALDNCVTIYPEADEPEWVLERMPSRRVISCMAPLPDGTYLINNGAQQGVAGFGLAQNPNLNALLYDPTRPVGARITVMANTTIPRMYHSESITLLDGRVLVSGSDPDDGVHPQEYRVEVFNPPYLTRGLPRPTFTLENTDWEYGEAVSFTLGGVAVNGDIEVSLLGAVSSTHGNSMGARTIFPEVTCEGTSCTVVAPPTAGICPPGWYQFFVLDGGIPAVGVYVRIGGDPAELGNWPNAPGFALPGV